MTQGRPDPEIVRRHLGAMTEAIQNLRRHAGRTADELRANADLRWTVERGLQLCVQNALDIATHVVAAAGLDAPDYSTAIERLGELGVLSADFATSIRPMAGFRNVLVHGYMQVDQVVVASVLKEKLADFEEFGRCVEAYLDRA